MVAVIALVSRHASLRSAAVTSLWHSGCGITLAQRLGRHYRAVTVVSLWSSVCGVTLAQQLWRHSGQASVVSLWSSVCGVTLVKRLWCHSSRDSFLNGCVRKIPGSDVVVSARVKSIVR